MGDNSTGLLAVLVSSTIALIGVAVAAIISVTVSNHENQTALKAVHVSYLLSERTAAYDSFFKAVKPAIQAADGLATDSGNEDAADGLKQLNKLSAALGGVQDADVLVDLSGDDATEADADNTLSTLQAIETDAEPLAFFSSKTDFGNAAVGLEKQDSVADDEVNKFLKDARSSLN